MIQKIDGALFRRMVISASASIDLNKQKINELNVFPVPDGDTGTNMGMTLGSAAADLQKSTEPTLTKAADMAASAMLRGARGNSGVILSLLFRGFSSTWKGKSEADGCDFAAALSAGVEAAYKAVMKPAEGTILTVSRLTAAAARDLAGEDDGIESVLSQCIDTAHAALDNTVNQNPVLKKAGVVDAGGMGFCMILEGMLAVLKGNDVVYDGAPETNDQADFTSFDSEDITFAYDTVYIVRKNPDVSIEPLRLYLDSIGDSLVIGEDDEAFKVHVHTNIPWEALNESQKYGTLELAKIENMRMQHDDLAAGRTARSTDDLEAIEQELESGSHEQAGSAAPTKQYGSVAVCAGAGLAGVFRDLGVDEVVEGGQTMNPSTADMLDAIDKVNADTVYILPNNKNVILAANQAVSLVEDKKIIVIPTKTVPQGITAVINYVPDLSAEENAAAMSEEIKRVKTGEVTYAVRDTQIDDKTIKQGDYMGIGDAGILTVGTDLDEITLGMIDNMMDDDLELISIYYGKDVTEEAAEKIRSAVAEKYSGCDVELQYGGQPIYYYVVSAE